MRKIPLIKFLLLGFILFGVGCGPRQPSVFWGTEKLIKALGQSNLSVKRNAIFALGNLGDPRAIVSLNKLLGDKNEQIRAEAATSLSYFRDPSSVSTLMNLASKDAVPAVRESAIGALSKFKDKRLEDIYLKALQDENLFVRVSAVYAISDTGDKAAIPALEKLRGQKEEIFKKAISKAIAKLQTPKLPKIPPTDNK